MVKNLEDDTFFDAFNVPLTLNAVFFGLPNLKFIEMTLSALVNPSVTNPLFGSLQPDNLSTLKKYNNRI